MQKKTIRLLLEMCKCLVLGLLCACSVKTPAVINGVSKKPNILIAYPSSTNLCVDGCRPHQNWIQFYLVSNSFADRSLRLKTSIWLAQILTLGISSTPCVQQDRPGYTCIDMEISHHLLWGLTSFDLTPLSQLRDTGNWWLEYASPHP